MDITKIIINMKTLIYSFILFITITIPFAIANIANGTGGPIEIFHIILAALSNWSTILHPWRGECTITEPPDSGSTGCKNNGIDDISH